MDNKDTKTKTKINNNKDLQTEDINQIAINLLKTKGSKEFIQHVFTHPETGKQLSYSEMRSLYG